MFGFSFLILRLLFIHIFYLDIVLLGDEQYRFHEGEIFFLHDEGDSVATTATTEAMIEILLRIDLK